MTMVNNSEYNICQVCRSIEKASTSNPETRRNTSYEAHVHVLPTEHGTRQPILRKCVKSSNRSLTEGKSNLHSRRK